jgi:hypothetical protein
MSETTIATRIAAEICENVAAHLDGAKSREDFDRDQRAAWDRAASAGAVASVAAIVCPTPSVRAQRKALNADFAAAKAAEPKVRSGFPCFVCERVYRTLEGSERCGARHDAKGGAK